MFAEFLISKGISKETERTEANEDGFFVEFAVEENVSENQLERLTNEFLKFVGKQQTDTSSLVPLNKIKKVTLRGLSGIASGGNRIFGFAAFSEEQNNKLEAEIKDRQERDHRKIGKELELFFFDQDAARGLPF
jgi:threonyl-tRNA synthetase